MNTLETISKRQSCRMYAAGQISDKNLEVVLQAANAAPVSMGNYADVKLIVVQSKEIIAKLEANAYAAMPNLGEHPAYGAPTVIIISAKKEEGASSGIPYCNASCIAENIMLAATDLGLGSVYLLAMPLTMQYNTELCKEAKIPEGFAPFVMIGIGNAAGELSLRELVTSKINTDYIR